MHLEHAAVGCDELGGMEGDGGLGDDGGLLEVVGEAVEGGGVGGSE